jgi:riboflavin kinase/FMN adenylyltransferase
MKLIRTLDPARAPSGPTALAIGNFDGLHLGHQALLERAQAEAPDLLPALMCFEPLPMTHFRPEQPVARLHSVRDRLISAGEFGIERVYMMRFNRRFASLSPEAFVSDVVVGVARARRVIVGGDFRFGAKAAGDVGRLVELGARLGFDVTLVDPVMRGDERISSSALRAALADGRMERVREMLGRPYCLHGRVLRGAQLGRTLGYPTANIRPPTPPAAHGIFAARVAGGGLKGAPAVVSLGLRPTVAGKNWLLEVHLFDYDGDLYGQHLRVELVARLRGEEKFDSLEAMRIQMDEDAAQARRILEA